MKFHASLFLLIISTISSNSVFASQLNGMGRVGLLSHFIFRGTDFNNKSPVIQADYVLAGDTGWWFGSFASNWTFQEQTEIEIDIFAGYDYQIAEGIVLKPAVVRYLFPNVGGHSTEWSLGLDIKDWTVKHHYDQHLNSRYSELNYTHTVNPKTNLVLHYGAYSNQTLSNQNDYEAKVTYQLKATTQIFAAFSSSDLDDNFIYGGFYLFF